MLSGWGPVHADIARQVAREEQNNPHWKWSLTDENGLLLHHGHTGRRPTPTEAAFVRARDRVCKTKGCRRPSTTCDLDHRHEHAKGGPTHRGNLTPECEPHHVMRTIHGYQVTFNPTTGTHTWTAPNGRVYTVTLDDDLNLTADLDNPHPNAYRQPTLPDNTPPEAGDEKTTGSSNAGDDNGAHQTDDTTQAMLDALIRKYGRRAGTDDSSPSGP